MARYVKNKFQRIGLLGGTFDPVHNGHIAICDASFKCLKLDFIYFIPSYLPVHKGSSCADAAKRLAMLQIAIKKCKNCGIMRYEIKNSKPTYSYQTIRHVKEKLHPSADLFFLIGEDMAESLDKWKSIKKAMKMAVFAYAPRKGYRVQKTKALMIKMKEVNISSTDIRQRIGQKKPIKSLVPAGIDRYVEVHNLYAASP